MNEDERQRILEMGSYRAQLDQLIARLPPKSSAQEVAEAHATALWEYVLTWRERLFADEWDYLVWWLLDELKAEEERLDGE